jgi:hypothetical protein
MNRNLFLFSALLWFFFACKEEKKPISLPKYKESKSEVKSTKNEISTALLVPKVQLKPESIPKFIIPDPYPPYDPYPEPYPIDPPGYISEPVITCVGPPELFPKTIRDSIVNFPATMASFGNNTNDIFKYIDETIAGSTECKFLRELGIEGKIYVRLLIDVNGKVREVTFLKFSDKELEMLKAVLNKTLFAIPGWSPARDEKGTAVVSEYTLPVRVSFQ